jgi:hypothetical protein
MSREVEEKQNVYELYQEYVEFIKQIKELEKKHHNDQDLGREVRKLIRNRQK